MTPEQLSQLRELAEKATPGPWKAIGAVVSDGGGTLDQRARNAEFSAAANPSTVLALLDALDRATADLRDQWECNHAERCDNTVSEYPHPDGSHCTWPYPASLAGPSPEGAQQ